MNLIVIPYGSRDFLFRPDSTLVRELPVYYLPDEVSALAIAPVLSVRIRKPGKSVNPRFAGRYLESFGFGLLLYPELRPEIGGHRDFLSNCLDQTSLVPNLRKDFQEESFPEQDFTCFINGVPLPGTVLPSPEEIACRLADITGFCSLRMGDLLLFPLCPAETVCPGDRIAARWQQASLFDFPVR